MKDILFEEHFQLIKDGFFTFDHVKGVDIALIRKSCRLTRKHMKGFAEWLNNNDYDQTQVINADQLLWTSGETYLTTLGYTTEQLIDKYFESLNK